MSITRGTIIEKTSWLLANTAPAGGGDTSDGGTDVDEDWTPGTTSDKFNRVGRWTYNLGPSGTQVIDLQADLGIDDAAMALVELRAFRIQADDANVGNVTLTVDPTNGFDAWLDTVSTGLILGPDSAHSMKCGVDGAYPVTPTTKELLLTNLDGANSAIVRIEAVGVDA